MNRGSKNMLKVDIKSKIYKMKNENFKALDNVSFEIKNKGIVCILGPSGSGKTTLMNIVGALDSDFDGDVVINNKSLKNSKNKDLDSYRKNTIGFIFQNFSLINKLTAYDNVKVALTLSNEKDKKNKIKELLKKVEMDKFAKRKVNVLSGGQKQRIAIARALANNPDIILADEPTGALDSKMSKEVMEVLKELSKTKLVLIITHSQELVDEYADSVIKMEDGKVLSIEDLKEKEKNTEKTENATQIKTKSMSFLKAFGYTLKNLSTRKARLVATSIGMSIGIVGIGLALALSNGTMQIAKSQIEGIMPTNMVAVAFKADETKTTGEMFSAEGPNKNFEYKDIVDTKNIDSNVSHFWLVPADVMKSFFSEVSISKDNATTTEIEPTSFYTQNGFEPYENITGNLTYGKEPENKNEVVISLNTAEYLLGADTSKKIEDLINTDIYLKYGPMETYGMDNPDNKILGFKIVGITSINTMGYSIYQNTMDTLNLYEDLYGKKKEDMKYYQVYIYLNNNLDKAQIQTTIEKLNNSQDKLKYTGAAESTLSNVETVLNVVRNVLIGFSSISVVVAILMIGIVIYTSVIERIFEIGILRAIGAKRKDIRNIFLSESVIIGLLSGLIGVGVTKLICTIINLSVTGILNSYGMNMGSVSIANLSNLAGISLIAVCVGLAIIAGIIPSQKAAKLDPIVALRRS
jgi:ABC-type lipoprotein export system ATPase subunit/ABC-type antimicrobial peptide transport system permease subunit